MQRLSLSRQIGRNAAWALVFLSVAYALVTVLGLASLKSSQEPIQDPFFAIMEILIILTAPLYIAVMIAIHHITPQEEKVLSLAALISITSCAVITSSIHFVILAIGRQSIFTNADWVPLVLSFKWPSIVYALDILAWDWFYGLAMLCTAFLFKGDQLKTILRIVLLVSGGLSIAGLLFLPFGNIQIRTMIGIPGYAGLGPVVYWLLAIILGRTEATSPQNSPQE
jgi:hypothetical protein